MNKNQRLIEILKEEGARLPKINGFGKDNHLEQYAEVYKYLNGSPALISFPDSWQVYDCVVNDIETAYFDYGVE